MFNRILTLLLSCFLCIFLSGCSSELDESNGSKETNSVSIKEIDESHDSKETSSVSINEIDDNVPTEYKQALKSAKSYLETSGFSKQGLYDQLTSEYADKFTGEEAQYAVDELFK